MMQKFIDILLLKERIVISDISIFQVIRGPTGETHQ